MSSEVVKYEGQFKVQFKKVLTVTGELSFDTNSGMFTLKTDDAITLINPKHILFIEGKRGSSVKEEYHSPVP